MALPASLSTCTVVGTYVDLSGNPVRGSISFTPQTILKETSANVIIIPVIIQKTFDATGSFSITVPVTDDPDVTPEPFVYNLEENFTGGRSFSIALPISVAGTTQNLADLLPAVSQAESVNYVTLDQYAALEARYSDANDTRVIVVTADVYETNAKTYADLASIAAGQVTKYNSNQLMLMGV